MTDRELLDDIIIRLANCDRRDLLSIRDRLEAIEAQSAVNAERPVRTLVLEPHPDDAHEWDQDRHLTREVKLSDIDDRDPYEDFDVSDVEEPIGVHGPVRDGG